MTWTYDVSQLQTSELMQVRYLVGDTIPKGSQVQDEEIMFALSQESNIYGAAATVCRSLAAQLSREADTVIGDQRVTYSSRARMYNIKAAQYDNQATARGGGLPIAGGITVSGKTAQNQDPNRVQPQFNIGMTDNFIPVAPAGNEVSDGGPPNNGTGGS